MSILWRNCRRFFWNNFSEIGEEQWRNLRLCIHECATVRMGQVSGARLLNFPQTWGEQRTPNAWRCIQFSLCSRKKPTNFSSRQMVCEPFADGAVQVHSPIHIYAHLVREPFANHSACTGNITQTYEKKFWCKLSYRSMFCQGVSIICYDYDTLVIMAEQGG